MSGEPEGLSGEGAIAGWVCSRMSGGRSVQTVAGIETVFGIWTYT
jgi:hypothetical protein